MVLMQVSVMAIHTIIHRIIVGIIIGGGLLTTMILSIIIIIIIIHTILHTQSIHHTTQVMADITHIQAEDSTLTVQDQAAADYMWLATTLAHHQQE